jgi:hypothetical protein
MIKSDVTDNEKERVKDHQNVCNPNLFIPIYKYRQ